MQTLDGSYLLDHILNCESEWPPMPVSLDIRLEKTSDEKLLELIKRGTKPRCQDAFAEIYKRYHLDVWRFIKSKLFSDADAKDVFAEVWIVALEKLPNFEWQGKPIKSWLLTVAENKRLELIRRIEKENSIPLNEDIHAQALQIIETQLQLDQTNPPENPSNEVQAEADRLLVQALAGLRPKPRKIIELIYFKGENSTEIGQNLGMKPGTVRQAHRRALEDLRRLLDSGEEE
jgi:RNA polymerase sigma-70 factor (ECF subfamily)